MKRCVECAFFFKGDREVKALHLLRREKLWAKFLYIYVKKLKFQCMLLIFMVLKKLWNPPLITWKIMASGLPTLSSVIIQSSLTTMISFTLIPADFRLHEEQHTTEQGKETPGNSSTQVSFLCCWCPEGQIPPGCPPFRHRSDRQNASLLSRLLSSGRQAATKPPAQGYLQSVSFPHLTAEWKATGKRRSCMQAPVKEPERWSLVFFSP